VNPNDLSNLYGDPKKKVHYFDTSKFMAYDKPYNKPKYSCNMQKRIDSCIINGTYMPELYSIYDEIEKRRAIVADDNIFNKMVEFTIILLRYLKS